MNSRSTLIRVLPVVAAVVLLGWLLLPWLLGYRVTEERFEKNFNAPHPPGTRQIEGKVGSGMVFVRLEGPLPDDAWLRKHGYTEWRQWETYPAVWVFDEAYGQEELVGFYWSEGRSGRYLFFYDPRQKQFWAMVPSGRM